MCETARDSTGFEVDELRNGNLSALSDDALEAELAEAHAAARVLEVRRLRLLAELDRRRAWQRDGYLSTTSWLAHRFAESHPQAASDVRMARALEAMPRTARALADGNISLSGARVLMSARVVDPEAFNESEPLLVEAAVRHSVRDLSRAVAYWRLAVESRKLEQRSEEDPLWEQRRLHVSPTVFGMVRIDGTLDPETGETVLTGLRSVLDVEAKTPDPDDRRTPAQRRADALGQVFRSFLDRKDRPQVGGERPHVTVTVDLEALLGRTDGPSELDHAGPISPELAKLLACDSSVRRVVLGPGSEPLDVGRATDVVPAPTRRAVNARDRHCRGPGCDRPPGWADVHHIWEWTEGGPTALWNLILLCRRHHRMVHRGMLRVEKADGKLVFRRPDGSLIEDRAPP